MDHQALVLCAEARAAMVAADRSVAPREACAEQQRLSAPIDASPISSARLVEVVEADNASAAQAIDAAARYQG